MANAEEVRGRAPACRRWGGRAVGGPRGAGEGKEKRGIEAESGLTCALVRIRRAGAPASSGCLAKSHDSRTAM